MKYKPEDFKNCIEDDEMTSFNSIGSIDIYKCAAVANEKLAKWLKDAPTVYGCPNAGKDFGWSTNKYKLDTHKARLVNIEDLDKKIAYNASKRVVLIAYMEQQIYRAKCFIKELQESSKRWDIDIDCHADFVSLLTDRKNDNQILAVLYGNCEPEYEWEKENQDTFGDN